MEYPLPQAAKRAEMDERSFRLLADRRVILATPRTRTQGRGKQKLYTIDEILIASVLAPLVKLGADSFSLGAAADWLRSMMGSVEVRRARSGKPVYVRLRYRSADDWGIELNEARSLDVNSSRDDASSHFLPVTEPGPKNNTWSRDFIAVKLDDKIQRVEENVLRTWRAAHLSPSDCLMMISDASSIHTPSEIDEMKRDLERLIGSGDRWSDA